MATSFQVAFRGSSRSELRFLLKTCAQRGRRKGSRTAHRLDGLVCFHHVASAHKKSGIVGLLHRIGSSVVGCDRAVGSKRIGRPGSLRWTQNRFPYVMDSAGRCLRTCMVLSVVGAVSIFESPQLSIPWLTISQSYRVICWHQHLLSAD